MKTATVPFYEASPVPFVALNTRGVILQINPAAIRLFGCESSQVLGKPFSFFLESPDSARFAVYLKTMPKDGSTLECCIRTSPDSCCWAEVITSPVRNGKNAAFHAALIDISERKRMEQEVLNVSLREQQRIGQDLHDSICQELTGTAFMAKVLEQNLNKKKLKDAEDARKIVDLIHQAISQTRRLSRGLLTWEIENNGLEAALTELAENTRSLFNVRCAVKYSPAVAIPSSITGKHLYRIAQEAVANAVKHGAAQNISIALFKKRHYGVLQIVDDGKGMAPGVSSSGMGLRINRYRANAIGADIEIRPGKRGGTVVECTFVSKNGR